MDHPQKSRQKHFCSWHFPKVCWPRSSRWSERSPAPLPWSSEPPPRSDSGPSWASPPRWRWPCAPSRTAPTPAWPPSSRTCRSAEEKDPTNNTGVKLWKWQNKRRYLEVRRKVLEQRLNGPNSQHFKPTWTCLFLSTESINRSGFLLSLNEARGCLLKRGRSRQADRMPTHRPAVDHQEGFGGAVEGAGGQRVGPAGDDVAQVVVGVGRLAEGELGESLIGFILVVVVQQVLQGVEKVAWKRSETNEKIRKCSTSDVKSGVWFRSSSRAARGYSSSLGQTERSIKKKTKKKPRELSPVLILPPPWL